MMILKPCLTHQIQGSVIFTVISLKFQNSDRNPILTASFVFHPRQPYGAFPFSFRVPPSVSWIEVGLTFLHLHHPQLLIPTQ